MVEWVIEWLISMINLTAVQLCLAGVGLWAVEIVRWRPQWVASVCGTIVDAGAFNGRWATQQCQLATSCHCLQNALLSTWWNQQRESRVSSHFLNYVSLFILVSCCTCCSVLWMLFKLCCCKPKLVVTVVVIAARIWCRSWKVWCGVIGTRTCAQRLRRHYQALDVDWSFMTLYWTGWPTCLRWSDAKRSEHSADLVSISACDQWRTDECGSY